jgi:hypothetical protein
MAGSWATREGEKDLAGWTSGRILAQSKIKEGKPFSFKQIGKPIWIQIKFKFQMTPIHKIKYKSTHQYKIKYVAAWMQQI